MISFRNVQHALASYFKVAANVIKKTPAVIEKIEGAKAEVEAVSSIAAAVVGGPGVAAATVTIEDAAFAALGALDAALKAGDAATEKKLLDAGLDQAAINAVKTVGVQSAAVYTLVKAQTK